MPRKQRSLTPPIVHKVSSLLKISIFIAKLRKPIIAKLVFLKESRKIKKFKLLRHYNYGFLEEYEFSPSNSPLFRYRFKNRVRGPNNLISMVFMCKCLRPDTDPNEDDYCRDWPGALEALPLPLPLPAIGDLSAGAAMPFSESDDDEEDDDDTVDERAERFIERFYKEMRMQRRLSV